MKNRFTVRDVDLVLLHDFDLPLVGGRQVHAIRASDGLALSVWVQVELEGVGESGGQVIAPLRFSGRLYDSLVTGDEDAELVGAVRDALADLRSAVTRRLESRMKFFRGVQARNEQTRSAVLATGPKLRWVSDDRVVCDDPGSHPVSFERGKEYRATKDSRIEGWARVFDETGEEYVYPVEPRS